MTGWAGYSIVIRNIQNFIPDQDSFKILLATSQIGGTVWSMKSAVTFISVLGFWLAVDACRIVAWVMIPVFILSLFCPLHTGVWRPRPVLRLTSTGVRRYVHHRK